MVMVFFCLVAKNVFHVTKISQSHNRSLVGRGPVHVLYAVKLNFFAVVLCHTTLPQHTVGEFTLNLFHTEANLKEVELEFANNQ